MPPPPGGGGMAPPGSMGAPPPEGAPGAKRKRALFRNPTTVLLLKNMVGPGEVDPELQVRGTGPAYGAAC